GLDAGRLHPRHPGRRPGRRALRRRVAAGDLTRRHGGPRRPDSGGGGRGRPLSEGKLTQTILEMEAGYLFVSAIAQGATLVVHAARGCDMGLVGYEMTMLVTRAGHALAPGPRTGVAR